MDILTLKRNLPVIENGRWVGGDEIAGLGDARVLVRGFSSRAVADLRAERERALPAKDMEKGRPTREALERLGAESLRDTLIDVDGFTLNGEPVGVETVREWIGDPAFIPLADLIMTASMKVDAERVAKAKELRGNL